MLPDEQKLDNNVLYLRLQDHILHYKCIDIDGKDCEGTLEWLELNENGADNELKPKNGSLEEFEAIKSAILEITSKRGHTRLKRAQAREKFAKIPVNWI